MSDDRIAISPTNLPPNVVAQWEALARGYRDACEELVKLRAENERNKARLIAIGILCNTETKPSGL